MSATTTRRVVLNTANGQVVLRPGKAIPQVVLDEHGERLRAIGAVSGESGVRTGRFKAPQEPAAGDTPPKSEDTGSKFFQSKKPKEK